MLPPKILLKDACPDIFIELTEYFSLSGNISYAQQLKQFWIASQKIRGNPLEFRCLGYCLPGISEDERKMMELIEEKEILVEIRNGHIKIITNEFGEFNWFYVTNVPQMYDQIRAYMA
jgi:hypothetical protein